MVAVLFLLNALTAVFEAFSVYLFIPLLSFLSNPNNFDPSEHLPEFISNFSEGFEDRDRYFCYCHHSFCYQNIVVKFGVPLQKHHRHDNQKRRGTHSFQRKH